MEILGYTTVASRVRYYRKISGMNQKQLAEICELNESTIRNYELGNHIPDWDTSSYIGPFIG